jgi:hypothetical protein
MTFKLQPTRVLHESNVIHWHNLSTNMFELKHRAPSETNTSHVVYLTDIQI